MVEVEQEEEEQQPQQQQIEIIARIVKVNVVVHVDDQEFNNLGVKVE